MWNFSMARASVPKVLLTVRVRQAAPTVDSACHALGVRRPALTLLLAVLCCAFPAGAAAAPWSFIVSPTEQIGVPGYPAATEITPEGSLYTGSAEVVFRFGPRQRPWNVPLRTLEEGRYPIVSSSARNGSVDYTLTTFSAAVAGQPVNFIRVRMRNVSSRT